MPNKDGTGPIGKGPMTGKQCGNCEGAEPIARENGNGCKGQRRNKSRCN